jgi:hypothetical protein
MSDPDFELVKSGFLSELTGVRHGFAIGRDLGAPAIDFASRPGNETDFFDGWRRAVQEVRPDLGPEHVALLDQVHGGEVVYATTGSGPAHPIGEFDGSVSASADVILTVRTADCVPVLFGTPSCVGVAHAGWRGVAAQVVQNTVARLLAVGGESPEDVRAFIGPCISGRRYEVGEEVCHSIEKTGVPRSAFVTIREGAIHADLGAAVEVQLRRMGIVKIDRIERCTFDDTRLHSYRRDGRDSGRLAGFISRDVK